MKTVAPKAVTPKVKFSFGPETNTVTLLYCHEAATSERFRNDVLAGTIEDMIMSRALTKESLDTVEADVERVTPRNLLLQRIYHKQAELDCGKTRYEARRKEMVAEKEKWIKKASIHHLNNGIIDFEDVFCDYRDCLIAAENYSGEFEHAYKVFTKPFSAFESLLPSLIGKPNRMAEDFQLVALYDLTGHHNRTDMLKFVMDYAKTFGNSYTQKRFDELKDIRF